MLNTNCLTISEIRKIAAMRFKCIVSIATALLFLSPIASAQIGLQAISSLERVISSADTKLQGASSAEIYAARNESESFQVVIKADQQPLKNVHIEMTELKSSSNDVIGLDNIHLFREISVLIRNSSNKAVFARVCFLTLWCLLSIHTLKSQQVEEDFFLRDLPFGKIRTNPYG